MKKCTPQKLKSMKSALILFFIFLFLEVYSQETYVITGKVVEKKQPVTYIEITLYNTDSLPVATTFTDDNGYFELKIGNKASYKLEGRLIGNVLFSTQLNIAQNENLEPIEISSSQELSEVVVVARKKIFERKVDRLVFNVENSAAAIGGDASDVLKITPTIRVQDDKISMIGKGQILVMVNGRLLQLSGKNLINYLKTLSADDIKSIEIISTPPAQYAAEGDSGMLNIILKKGVTNSWSNTVSGAFIQTTYPAASLSNTFNYNKNKLSLSASISGKKGHEAQILSSKIYNINTFNNTLMNSKQTKDFYDARLAADYNFSEKTTLGFIIQHSSYMPDGNDSSHLKITANNSSYTANVFSKGVEKNTDKNTTYNLHFAQKLDTLGRSISADFDHFSYQENKERNFQVQSITDNPSAISTIQTQNSGGQNIKNYSFNIAVEHPTKWANISYGGKLSFLKTESNAVFYNLTNGSLVLDTLQSNDFEYNENTQAAFFDISKKLGQKWQIKGGLRYENTTTNGYSKTYNKTNNNQYGKLFPTLYLAYELNENHLFNANYGRRVNRPEFWKLNPFRWYLDANSYTEGNPFLQPSFSHNVEISYIYKQKLFSNLILQIQENQTAQIPRILPDKKQQIYTFENYGTSYAFGLVEVYIFKPLKYIQSTNQFYLLYSLTEINKNLEAALPVQNGWYSSASTQNVITLNRKGTIKGEVNFTYNFPSSGSFVQTATFYNLDIALRFSLPDNKLDLSIAAYDILRTSNPNYTLFTDGIKQIYNTYYDSRFLKIGLSYRFGNKKIQVEEKSTGNEDEQNRVK